VHRQVAVPTPMIGGIVLLGVVTGLVASWFVRTIEGAGQQADELAGLRRELRAAVDALTEARARASGTGETSFTDERPAVR
jgi:voltage-gated potassium channel